MSRQADGARLRRVHDARGRRPERYYTAIGTATTGRLRGGDGRGGAHLQGRYDRRDVGQVSGRRPARLRLPGGQRRAGRRPTTTTPFKTGGSPATLETTPASGSGRRPSCGRRPASRRSLADFETPDIGGDVERSTPTSTGRTSRTWASTPICCRSGPAASARRDARVGALDAGADDGGRPLVTTASTHAFGRATRRQLLLGVERLGRAHGDDCSGWPTSSAPTPKYLEHHRRCSSTYLLGRNSYDRSQVTMVGYHPPEQPAPSGRRRPTASSDPWPGLLVGGANSTSSDDAAVGHQLDDTRAPTRSTRSPSTGSPPSFTRPPRSRRRHVECSRRRIR